MKSLRIILSVSLFIFSGLSLSGCENTSVSGSVSYGMGVGYGYPMYYGPRGNYHNNIMVVSPPRGRPSRPAPRPMPRSRGR